MPLITQSIPNLIGGVSQQAPSIRRINQCEEMVNAFPSPVEGLVKRHPSTAAFHLRNASTTIYTGASASNIKPHFISRDATEKYFASVHPAASAGSCAIEVYKIDGTKQTVNYDASGRDYLVNATRDTLKMMTVADVTFVVNTAKTPALQAGTTTGINYDRIALVYIKQTGENREVEITVSDTNGGNALTVSHKTANVNAGTDHAAGTLAGLITGQNPGGVANGTYTATSSDSVIKITRAIDFNITVNDDFGGQGAILIRESVQRFEDLPAAAPHDHVVKVIGVPENAVDDYYVKFVCVDGSGFTKGVWQEAVAPGAKHLYDYGTMPHILIRQSNGTFLFKRADGLTPSSPTAPAGADYSAYQWTPRVVGDDLTNSAPSFVGVPITNLVLFKNRLGFLSDENIILSETSEFFNFWRTTVLDVPDSDPIDIASSSPKIGKLKSGIVFNTELILFTDSSQLVLRGGDILSPKSVALLPVGDYEAYSDINPVSSGLSVFFGYDRGGGYSGVRELVPQQQIDGQYAVNTVSLDIPSYIKGKIIHIASTTQEDVVAMVASGNLYMYKFTKSADGIVQSAWFRYNFPDTASSGFATVLWAEFVDTELYVLLARSSSNIPVIEKIRMGVNLTDAAQVNNANWVSHLDARELKASGTGTYSSATGLTTWNLAKPYSYKSGNHAVYTTSGASLKVTGGTAYNTSSDAAGTISVSGDYSGTAVWIGYRYEMLYQFSQFWLQGGAGRNQTSSAALQSGRYQLKNLSVIYEDTSFFKATINVGGEDNYEYQYSGLIVGSSVLNQIYLNRGSFRIPIYGRNLTTTVTITNDTALPCKLLSAEIEGDYVDRAQRYS